MSNTEIKNAVLNGKNNIPQLLKYIFLATILLISLACNLVQLPQRQNPSLEATSTAIPSSILTPENLTFPEVSKVKISEAPQSVGLLKWVGEGVLQNDKVFYSSKHELIAVSSIVGLYLFDSLTLNEIGVIDKGNTIDIAAFSPDGTRIITSSYRNNIIKLWDSKSQEKVLEKDLGGKVPSIFQHNGVYDIVYTPNGKFVIIRSINGIYILNPENLEIIHFIDVIEGERWLQVSPDSQKLASLDNYTIVVWDIQSGEQLPVTMSYELMEKEGWISNSHLLSNTPIESLDELHLNESIANKLTKGIPEGRVTGENIDFNNQIAAVYNNGLIEIWGFGNGELQLIRILDDIQKREVETIAFLASGKKFIVYFDDHTFQIWDTSSWESIYNIDIVLSGYYEFSPDAQQIASLTVEPETVTVELWDIKTGQLVKNKFRSTGLRQSENDGFSPMSDIFAVLKYSSDGKQLAIGNVKSNHILILDTATGKDISSLNTAGVVNQIMHFQNEQILARVEVRLEDLASSILGFFRLWDVGSGQLIRENEASEEYVHAYSISPDGKLLAASNRESLRDSVIELINMETGDVQFTLEQPGDVIYIEYLLDGRLLVSISRDGIIRFWGVPSTSSVLPLVEPPTQTSSQTFTCPKAPNTQVKIGDKAITLQATTRLRSQPEVNDNNIIFLLAQGDQLEVIDGPVCSPRPNRSDSYVFWKVIVPTRSLEGWVAEGDAENYYIAPNK